MGPGLPEVSTVITFAVHQVQIKASLHIIISAVASVKESGANVPASPGTTHRVNFAEVIQKLITSLTNWLARTKFSVCKCVREGSSCNGFMWLANIGKHGQTCHFVCDEDSLIQRPFFHLQASAINHDLRLKKLKVLGGNELIKKWPIARLCPSTTPELTSELSQKLLSKLIIIQAIVDLPNQLSSGHDTRKILNLNNGLEFFMGPLHE